MKKSLRNALISIILFFSLICVTSCGPTKLLPDNPQPPPPFFVPEKIRVALVLGSGGVRGMAHVGVIEELVNAGIHFDLIVGCSAGSIVGALYADNPNIECLKTSVWGMRTNTMLDIDIWHCRYGLSSGKPMHYVIDKYLTAETFSELQIPLVVVTTDLHTGESVPIGAGDLVTAVQSSCSIPLVFTPCKHMGRVFVDGGVINPVPTRVAYDLGADYIIAVDLCELLDTTTPYNLFDVGARSAEIAFMWQNQACSRWANVVIRPKTCGVGAFNDKLKQTLYEAGKSAAREKIPEIKAAFAKQAREAGCNGNSDLSQWRLIEPKCYTPKIYNENY